MPFLVEGGEGAVGWTGLAGSILHHSREGKKRLMMVGGDHEKYNRKKSIPTHQRKRVW